jgi:hypothetical protein
VLFCTALLTLRAALECVVDAANAHARLTGLPAAPAPPAPAREAEETHAAASGSDTDEGDDVAVSARMSEVDSLLSRLGMTDDGVTSALVPTKAS